MEFWKPDLNKPVKVRILPNCDTGFRIHFIPTETLQKCKASVPKDYRIDFLQAVQDNPELKGESRYDMEEKYGTQVVIDCAFGEDCLVFLDGVGKSNEDFYWKLTEKGNKLLSDYKSRKSEFLYNEMYPEVECPICKELEN